MFIRPYTSQQPVDDFGLVFSDLKYSASLAASTDTTLTIPGNAPRYKAIISAPPTDNPLWVALNATAAVPAGASFASTNSELVSLVKICREVRAGDVIHFFTLQADLPVSVILYALDTIN